MQRNWLRRVAVIDSHTGGEPTRIVVAGGPDLGTGSVAEQACRFRDHHDRFRSFVVHEPRGSDVIVGGLLVPPQDPRCTAGVIFFNNVGILGMCGHGTIGLLATLYHLDRIAPGDHFIETPVGVVQATLHDAHTVSVRNVPSYRTVANHTVNVEGYGPVTGDIAWGGNWFYLVTEHRERIEPAQVARLTELAWRIRQAVNATSAGRDVDHVELFGPPLDPANHSRNFVLCPGQAYDRSPCGTGTSAKLACLAARGQLAPQQPWRQESILGSVFTAFYEDDVTHPGRIIPTIRGEAFISAESTLLTDAADPFADGIR